jgi:predicted  nucleic acid-binding Zn-ribbon protein
MTTQKLTEEVVALKTQVAGMDEKMSDACSRLKVVETEVKEQGKLLQTIDRLVMGLGRLDEKITDLSGKIDGLGGRIKLIELKPAEKWERIIYEILKYIVLAGLGFIAAKLLGK